MEKALVVVFVIALVIFLIVTGPLLIIWALNQLFAFTIAYTFWNWLATLILFGSLTASCSK
jgi:hypothetical protein